MTAPRTMGSLLALGALTCALGACDRAAGGQAPAAREAGGPRAVTVAPLEVAAPTGVTAFYMPEREAVAVAWDRAPGAASYDVMCRSGGPFGKCDAGTAGRLLMHEDTPIWFPIEHARPGATWEVEVVALASDGSKSAPSARVSVTVPLRVRALHAVGGDGRAILQWQMVPDEDDVGAYVILRDGAEVDALAPPAARPRNDEQLFWYDDGLRDGRPVRYELAIRDATGALQPGPRATVTPRARLLLGPTLALDAATGALWTARGVAEELISPVRPVRALDPRVPRRLLDGVTLAVGDQNTVMVRLDDGTWLAAGANEGRFPIAGVYHPSAVELPGLEAAIGAPLVDVALGADHGCGRTEAGDVWCWGADDAGQLGDGAIGGDGAGPSRVLVGEGDAAVPLTGAVSLAVGVRYACAGRGRAARPGGEALRPAMRGDGARLRVVPDELGAR